MAERDHLQGVLERLPAGSRPAIVERDGSAQVSQGKFLVPGASGRGTRCHPPQLGGELRTGLYPCSCGDVGKKMVRDEGRWVDKEKRRCPARVVTRLPCKWHALKVHKSIIFEKAREYLVSLGRGW